MVTEKLRKKLCEQCNRQFSDEPCEPSECYLLDAIKDAVEVVHGRWEKHEPDKHGNRKPKCSVCGEYHLAWWSDYTHCNYCPNCGAKMDANT